MIANNDEECNDNSDQDDNNSELYMSESHTTELQTEDGW